MTQIDKLNERIKIFLAEKFPMAQKCRLADDEPLLERGILDSMGVLEVVQFMEQEFCITLADEDLLPEHFQTVNHLAAFVKSKIAGTLVSQPEA